MRTSAMRELEARLRLWHLFAAVAIEGMIAGGFAEVFRGTALGIQGVLALTVLACAALVVVVCATGLLVWHMTERKE
jgi:hypothetical protein